MQTMFWETLIEGDCLCSTMKQIMRLSIFKIYVLLMCCLSMYVCVHMEGSHASYQYLKMIVLI